MSKFNITEILNFAVEIERAGNEFYRKAAEKYPGKKAGAVLASLAEDELEHKKKFAGMLRNIELYEQPVELSDDYYAYLKAFESG